MAVLCCYITIHHALVVFRALSKKNKKKCSFDSEIRPHNDENLHSIDRNEPCGLSLSEFEAIFPHHICFDKDFRLLHYGVFIKRYVQMMEGDNILLTDIIQLIYPDVPLTYQSLLAFANNIFVCILKGFNDNEPDLEPITLKGSMTVMTNGHIMYMCSLDVSTVVDLRKRKLYLSDMQLYDVTRDLIMINQSRLFQIKYNEQLEEVTKNLKKLTDEITKEKCKWDELLSELMPSSIAKVLRMGQPVEAREYPEVTILFSDIVTFTTICAACTPYEVVDMLNDLYSKFDRIAKLLDVYKVETIGDAYMVASGVPNQCNDHSERIMNMAIGMQMETKSVMRPRTNTVLSIRLGIHTGLVVAGVVGVKMPRYCLFGDTVSIANKMESHGIPRKIHVSEKARNSALQTNQLFEFTDRGIIHLKDVGPMHTYFLKRNGRKTVWDICDRPRRSEQSADGYQELHEDVKNTVSKKAIFSKMFRRKVGKVEHHPLPLIAMFRPTNADVQRTTICTIT